VLTTSGASSSSTASEGEGLFGVRLPIQDEVNAINSNPLQDILNAGQTGSGFLRTADGSKPFAGPSGRELTVDALIRIDKDGATCYLAPDERDFQNSVRSGAGAVATVTLQAAAAAAAAA
jgi:hypothetical protein